MLLAKLRFRGTRRHPEELGKAITRHAEAGAVVEVFLVEAEGAIRLYVDDVIEDGLLPARRTIRSQAHELVLTGVHPETHLISERGVKESERMGKVYLLVNLQIVSPADSPCGRRPLTHAVERQDGRFLER